MAPADIDLGIAALRYAGVCPDGAAMRRSARTAAAMKNLRANLDARMRDAGPAMSAGLVKRGPDNVRDVDPETRRLINEALAARGMRGTGG